MFKLIAVTFDAVLSAVAIVTSVGISVLVLLAVVVGSLPLLFLIAVIAIIIGALGGG